jgi:hypothetical protein
MIETLLFLQLKKEITHHEEVEAVTLQMTCTYITYLLHGLSPQANYTDRVTAACWRS